MIRVKEIAWGSFQRGHMHTHSQTEAERERERRECRLEPSRKTMTQKRAIRLTNSGVEMLSASAADTNA
eukprot:1389028-Amorphochlora_amoeboformis.AAC.1